MHTAKMLPDVVYLVVGPDWIHRGDYNFSPALRIMCNGQVLHDDDGTHFSELVQYVKDLFGSAPEIITLSHN